MCQEVTPDTTRVKYFFLTFLFRCVIICIMKGIKNRFVLGLAVVIPIFATVFIVYYLTKRIGGILTDFFSAIPHLSFLPGYVIALLGFFVVLLLIYIIGLFASSFIGRGILRLVDGIFQKIPLIRIIYSAIRQFANAMFIDRTAFRRAVLVEFPRDGQFSIGFVTNERGYEKEGKGLLSLFIPTTPNITTGFYILSKKEDTIPLAFSIDKAFKVLISGGIISISDIDKVV